MLWARPQRTTSSFTAVSYLWCLFPQQTKSAALQVGQQRSKVFNAVTTRCLTKVSYLWFLLPPDTVRASEQTCSRRMPVSASLLAQSCQDWMRHQHALWENALSQSWDRWLLLFKRTQCATTPPPGEPRTAALDRSPFGRHRTGGSREGEEHRTWALRALHQRRGDPTTTSTTKQLGMGNTFVQFNGWVDALTIPCRWWWSGAVVVVCRGVAVVFS